jgi:mitochondrial FAD-linked sulfhydryl oxidase
MNADVGNVLWTLLHGYSAAYPDEPDDVRQQEAAFWLEVFQCVVVENSNSCPCKREWERILRICPPPLHSGAEFHLWTLAAHDRVNRKLGKPMFHAKLTAVHLLLTTP